MNMSKQLSIILTTIILFSPCLCQIPPGPMVPPAIYLENITFSDDSPLEGEMIEIRSAINSNQSVPLANLTARLFIDQVEVGNITGIELGPKAWESITFEWIAEKWTHIVMLTVDQGSRPISTATVSNSITVEAKPIGDLYTLVLSVTGIVLFIMVIMITPSIIARMRR